MQPHCASLASSASPDNRDFRRTPAAHFARFRYTRPPGTDLALWRAAELALEVGYPALTVSERDNDTRVEVFGDPYYDPFVYPGYPFLYPPYPFFHYGPPFGHLRHPFYSSYYEPYAELMVSVTITVTFGGGLGGEDLGAGALDAQATLERLREQYPDAVAAPPP